MSKESKNYRSGTVRFLIRLFYLFLKKIANCFIGGFAPSCKGSPQRKRAEPPYQSQSSRAALTHLFVYPSCSALARRLATFRWQPSCHVEHIQREPSDVVWDVCFVLPMYCAPSTQHYMQIRSPSDDYVQGRAKVPGPFVRSSNV